MSESAPDGEEFQHGEGLTTRSAKQGKVDDAQQLKKNEESLLALAHHLLRERLLI